ncbi:MAG: undecaprenyl-diphosphate phosphatase [Pirellulales bacterium]
MSLLQIIISGIVQGITEFLPVSSSGHLVVLASIFEQLEKTKLPDVVEVNILLHAGTLGAIICFYWRRILQLLTDDRRVIGLIIVGTLPVILVGVPLKMYCKPLLENPLVAGFMFLQTGALLIWSGRHSDGKQTYQELTYRQAIWIGLFQAAAVLPGLSRSGWTIASGMLTGLRRESAATYSFLLAIPAIAGAAVWELKGVLEGETSGTPPTVLAVGTAVAFVVGLISLSVLIKIVRRGHLGWFAVWLIPLGIAVIIWQLFP